MKGYTRDLRKDGEKEVFQLIKAKERRTRNSGNIRYIKHEDSKVPIEEAEIKER